MHHSSVQWSQVKNDAIPLYSYEGERTQLFFKRGEKEASYCAYIEKQLTSAIFAL